MYINITKLFVFYMYLHNKQYIYFFYKTNKINFLLFIYIYLILFVYLFCCFYRFFFIFFYFYILLLIPSIENKAIIYTCIPDSLNCLGNFLTWSTQRHPTIFVIFSADHEKASIDSTKWSDIFLHLLLNLSMRDETLTMIVGQAYQAKHVAKSRVLCTAHFGEI